MKKKLDKNKYTKKIMTNINFKEISNIIENDSLENVNIDENNIIKYLKNERIIENVYNININVYKKIIMERINELKKECKYLFVVQPSFLYLQRIDMIIKNKNIEIYNNIKKINIYIGQKLYDTIEINNKYNEQEIYPLSFSFSNGNIQLNKLKDHKLEIEIELKKNVDNFDEYIDFYANHYYINEKINNVNDINQIYYNKNG